MIASSFVKESLLLEEDIKDQFNAKLVEYLKRKDSYSFPEDLTNLYDQMKGRRYKEKNKELQNNISKLSKAYWNFKGFYDFPTGGNKAGSGSNSLEINLKINPIFKTRI